MKGCRIVPAIDLLDGVCVRLRRGDFASYEVVNEDPLAAAQMFYAQGFRRLHVVDLTGAKDGVPKHLDCVKSIAKSTELQIDYSGGLRTTEALQQVFDSGVSFVVVGSQAVLDPTAVCGWTRRFGGERIIIGLDVADGCIRIKGWQETSEYTLADAVGRYQGVGVRAIMSTDINCDGMLEGPNLDMYRNLGSTYPHVNFIASGGVSCAADIKRLAEAGVSEVIVGKALYAGRINVEQVREFVW
jgi:phosphoribosylformimino-5-aminoimidazole carboxamide ribotide isomerase